MMRRDDITEVVPSLVCDGYQLAVPGVEQSPFFDLLLWATICNRDALVEYFWSKDRP
jgi:hypothetical protein